MNTPIHHRHTDCILMLRQLVVEQHELMSHAAIKNLGLAHHEKEARQSCAGDLYALESVGNKRARRCMRSQR